jgi:hypothetical protein
MRWTGHVASISERRGVYRVLMRRPEGKNQLGDPGVEGKILLGWIFRNWNVGHGLDRSESG